MESEKKSNSKIQLAQEAKARNKDLGQAQRKQFSCLLAVASAMEKIIPRPSYMPKRFWSPVLSEVKNSQPILRSRPATNKIKLQGVLQEDESLKVFKEFMKAEHNEENLEFWCEVNTFRKQNSLKRKEHARKIVSTYVGEFSEKQVNLSCSVRKRVEDCVKDARKDMFDAAQTDIFHLMEVDCFRRFKSKPNAWLRITQLHLQQV